MTATIQATSDFLVRAVQIAEAADEIDADEDRAGEGEDQGDDGGCVGQTPVREGSNGSRHLFRRGGMSFHAFKNALAPVVLRADCEDGQGMVRDERKDARWAW